MRVLYWLKSLETHRSLASHLEKYIFKWEPPRSMVGQNADPAFMLVPACQFETSL